MDYRIKNERIIKEDSWSAVIEFNGVVISKSGNQLPCTGKLIRFEGSSSVVTPGEEWLEEIRFRPHSGAAEVVAEFHYTDRIWGSGNWVWIGPKKFVDEARNFIRS